MTEGQDSRPVLQNGILLVVPPFQTTVRPALGVSQLKANLQDQGFPTKISYLNFRFAERIGLDLFEWISENTYDVLLGELIFSHVLFHHSDDDIEQYATRVLAGDDAEKGLMQFFPHKGPAEILRLLTQEASTFCRDDAANMVVTHDPWMVGLTSSFQQSCSSLAIIKKVKQRRPDVLTVLGGANCEAEMGVELFRLFPDVDHIGQGECDHSFVDLVRSLRNGNRLSRIPGILSRPNREVPPAAQHLLGKDLDQLPNPDFSDYFAQLGTMKDVRRIAPGLVMETSRGCWWGAKQHCTFCGLNADAMGFRSKSASRARDEMATLVSQYGARHIAMADNILDMKYFKSLLPGLAKDPIVELFYETKGNLSKRQIQLLAQSEIRRIQPGIESLSSRTLQLMRKGITQVQNIQLLKWCSEFGVAVMWNYLYGFPGEREEEFSEIAQDIEAIHHLQPPSRLSTIRMDRFSPYFDSPDSFNLGEVYPAEPYRHIYPFPNESLKRIAYFYHCDFFADISETPAFRACEATVTAWQQAYWRSYLLAIPAKQSLLIIDTRSCAQGLWHRLDGVRREVYELCDKARTLSNIRDAVSNADVETILGEFVRARLMIQADGKYLSLAVSALPNCGKVVHPLPGGFVIQRRLDKLKRVVTFRMPAGRIVVAVGTRVLSKAMPLITRCLSRAREDESG